MRHMIFGESHGPAIGVVVEGVPAGLELNLEEVQRELDRRKPGQGPTATARKESDTVQVLSALGADIEEQADALVIRGKEKLPGGVTVSGHNDHRIAMMAAIAATRCEIGRAHV